MFIYGTERIGNDKSTVITRWKCSEEHTILSVESMHLRPDELRISSVVEMWERSVPNSGVERELWDLLKSDRDKGVPRDGDQLLLDI